MDGDRGRQRIAQYRDTWDQLQAAAGYAADLLHRVAPEELAGLLPESGESPPADVPELVALLDWFRRVTAAVEQRRRRANRPTLPGRRPPLTVRFRIQAGSPGPRS